MISVIVHALHNTQQAKSARQAVLVMGDLATTHGYNDAGESLLVVDTEEGYIFHVPSDSVVRCLHFFRLRYKIHLYHRSFKYKLYDIHTLFLNLS